MHSEKLIEQVKNNTARVINAEGYWHEYNISPNLENHPNISENFFLNNLSYLASIRGGWQENMITDYNINDWCKALKKNTALEEFRLSSNELESENVIKLINALWSSESLESIYLNGNKIDNNGLEKIALWLKKNSRLRTIDLAGNNYVDLFSGIILLLNFLQRNKSLQKLHLPNIYLQEKQIPIFFKEFENTIRINKTLKKLEFSLYLNFHFSDTEKYQSILDTLANCLKQNKGLRTLKINFLVTHQKNCLTTYFEQKLQEIMQSQVTLTSISVNGRICDFPEFERNKAYLNNYLKNTTLLQSKLPQPIKEQIFSDLNSFPNVKATNGAIQLIEQKEKLRNYLKETAERYQDNSLDKEGIGFFFKRKPPDGVIKIRKILKEYQFCQIDAGQALMELENIMEEKTKFRLAFVSERMKKQYQQERDNLKKLRC